MYRHFSGIGRIICSAIPLFLALVVTSSHLYSQTATPTPPTGSGDNSTDDMLTSEGTETENPTTAPTEEPKNSTEALTATESITTALSTTSEPTPAPLPDIVVYDSCTEMPEGSYQREQCLGFVAQYGTVNGARFFQKYVLVNKTDVLDETISGFYNNDEHKENGLKPRTVFFFDRRRGTYSIEWEIDFEASFALVGLKQGNQRPVIRTSRAFHRRYERNVMIEVDYRDFEDEEGNVEELEMMVIQGMSLNANFPNTSVTTDLDTTIATDSQVKVRNVIIADNEFIDDRNPGGDDHDEHILIRNAVGNVSIVNNIFENNFISEKAVEIRCRPSVSICNTEVLFRYNDIHASDITSALRLEDIPVFTIDTNTVSFGEQASGSSREAVFDIFYEDQNGVTVRGSIQNNQIRGMGGNTRAVLIQADGDEAEDGGAEAGMIYHSGNVFGDYPVEIEGNLPGVSLISGVPPEMVATTTMLTTDMPTTTASSATTSASEATAGVSNPTTQPAGQDTPTPPVTLQTTLVSDILPPSTTLPIRSSTSANVVACENQCGVSAGEAVGFTALSIAEAVGVYEITALLAFMGKHWGHTAKQIPTYWNYVTLGAVYALKRWGPIATGMNDTLELTADKTLTP